MTNDSNRMAEIEEFGRVLDVFGADQARWPATRRNQFLRLVDEDLGARNLLGEAKALDGLLDRLDVTPTKAAQQALAARILEVAKRDQGGHLRRDGAPAANVIQLRWREPAAARPRPAIKHLERWQAAAVLAASLLAGVLIGATSNSVEVMQQVADAVGLPVEFESASVAMHDSAGVFGEDTL